MTNQIYKIITEQEVNQELTTKIYNVEINSITNDITKRSISSTDKQDLEFMISIGSMDSNSLASIFVTFIQAIKLSILSSNTIYTTFENPQNIIVSDDMTIGSTIIMP
ncbi:11903_t:CDS:1 [Funneliformis caledonium]|uniref:11903_t:CDS:1 n=1 Tax=Funneliformis caledonium TaxID=1117310 RepID=A0A9N9CY50_9GLOM|nr:11903_t:CDS:1 [Funneliformis caledonium]